VSLQGDMRRAGQMQGGGRLHKQRASYSRTCLIRMVLRGSTGKMQSPHEK